MSIDTLCAQRKQYQLYNKPPIRFTPHNPYSNFTQDQLNMRRKVEILKYKKNSTQGSQLTKKEKYTQMVNGNYNISRVVCPNDKLIPVLSTASGIPGPAMYLVEDDNVPLYNYAQNTNAYGDQIQEDDDEWILNVNTNQLILSGQDHTTFCNLIIRPLIKQPYTTYTLQTPVLFRLQGIGMPASTNDYTITAKITPTNSTDVNSFLTTYNGNPVANNNSSVTTFLQNDSIKFTLSAPPNESTYNYFCEAYVGLVEFSNILLNTSPGFVYDFKFNYIINYTITDTNGDIMSVYSLDYVTNFELYINLGASSQLKTTQDALLTVGAGLTDTITTGIYTDLVTTTSGNGSGAILTVVASIVTTNPEITSVTVTTAGTGYAVGDTLTVTAATLAATGRSTDLVFTLIANNLNEQATENCNITTDFGNLPDKKIVFSGN
jgi:hypothetical protein